MYHRLREAGLQQCWVDVLKYRPNADLLDWCVQLLPRPVVMRAASGSQQAQKKRSPFGVATSSSRPVPIAASTSSAVSQRVKSSLPGFSGSLTGASSRRGQSPHASAQTEVDDDSLAGGERQCSHASAQSEVDDDSPAGGDEQNCSLPESVQEYRGRLGNDPDRPQGQVHRTVALASDQQRIVILALPSSVPIAVGPCKLRTSWKTASSRADVGTATRPEYGITVVQSESIPLGVKESRAKLAHARVSTRRDALQALKARAAEVLIFDEAVQVKKGSLQTVELWRTTLCRVSTADAHAEAPVLESCVYAFAIVQALAISAADPVLLFTPQVMAKLLPLRQLLADCEILQAARMVVRLFWMAVHNASYGQDEA